jgi:hypothetical protein
MLTVSADYSVKDNKYQHPYDTFVLCSCAVQSKLVMPIIRELDMRQARGDRDEKLKALLERFRCRYTSLVSHMEPWLTCKLSRTSCGTRSSAAKHQAGLAISAVSIPLMTYKRSAYITQGEIGC